MPHSNCILPPDQRQKQEKAHKKAHIAWTEKKRREKMKAINMNFLHHHSSSTSYRRSTPKNYKRTKQTIVQNSKPMTSTNLAIGATRSVCGAQLPRRAVVATGGAFGDLVLAGGAQGAFLGPRGRLLFLLEGDGVRRKTANATRFASARVNEVGAVLQITVGA
jgi:hypothetical protein